MRGLVKVVEKLDGARKFPKLSKKEKAGTTLGSIWLGRSSAGGLSSILSGQLVAFHAVSCLI